MSNKKETAEQKLLKMIESTAGSEVKAKTEQKVLKKQSLLSVLKSINKILTLCVVFSSAYLAFEVYQGMGILGKEVNIDVNTKTSRKVFGMETVVPVFQDLPFYLTSVARRNIFQPIESERAKSVASTDKNSKLAQLTQNLKLVGVSWLDSVDSASVMIEDTDKKVTHFLQKGEKFGDIIIKTIYADSAVLGYGNEEITIRYDKPQM